MSGRYGRYRAALGGLIAAFAIFSGYAYGDQAKQAVGAPSAKTKQQSGKVPSGETAQHVKQNPRTSAEGCGKPYSPIESTDCAEVRSAAAAEAQAEATRDQLQLGWWQVWGLIASFGVSSIAAVAAAVAAREATKATAQIPILERAYPYVVIKSHDTERALMSGAESSAVMSKGGRATVQFLVKNYGKTPATLLDIFAEVLVTGTGRVRDVKGDFFPKEVVLGESDETEAFDATMDLDIWADEFFAIHHGSQHLIFMGWVRFRDVWGEDHTAPFSWRYNPIYRTWVTKPQK